MVGVELDQRERARADRRLAERIVGERLDRDAARAGAPARSAGWPAGGSRRAASSGRTGRSGRRRRSASPRATTRRRVRCTSDRAGRLIVKTTSSAVTGSPSCQRASGRSVNVHDLPVSSVVQRAARSGISMPSGPSLTRPENARATRSRSAWVRAASGLTETGRPIVPSRYGGRGLGRSGDGVGARRRRAERRHADRQGDDARGPGRGRR